MNTMNGITRTILGVTATAGIAVGAAVLAAPAQASGTPGCVSKSEYRHIHNGQTQAQVQRIVGAKGKVISQFHSRYASSVYREFKMCHASQWSSVDVTFSTPGLDGRVPVKVDSKAWYRI